VNDLINVFFYNRTFAIFLEATGLVFFAAFTIYSLVRVDKRTYLPSLVILDCGIVAALVRTLFFPPLVPPSGARWRHLASHYRHDSRVGIRDVRAGAAART
jgi:hypothetical protein